MLRPVTVKVITGYGGAVLAMPPPKHPKLNQTASGDRGGVTNLGPALKPDLAPRGVRHGPGSHSHSLKRTRDETRAVEPNTKGLIHPVGALN